MSAMKKGESLTKLTARAGMGQFQFNTGVIIGTDNQLRIVINPAVETIYGDCVAVGFNNNKNHFWHYTHLSPARARLLAHHLLRHAARLEESSDPGMNQIDWSMT
jgi:hypothetical protein